MQHNNPFKFKHGFTLIELLVVIVIIGILSSIVSIVSLNSQKKARDSQRKSDLEAVKKALEAAKNDCLAGSYYPAVSQPQDTDGASYYSNNQGDLSYYLEYYGYFDETPKEPKYVENTPNPINYLYYFPYWADDPDFNANACPEPGGSLTRDGLKDYRLVAKLEVSTDPDILKSQERCPSDQWQYYLNGPVSLTYGPNDYVVCPD